MVVKYVLSPLFVIHLFISLGRERRRWSRGFQQCQTGLEQDQVRKKNVSYIQVSQWQCCYVTIIDVVLCIFLHYTNVISVAYPQVKLPYVSIGKSASMKHYSLKTLKKQTCM